MPHCVILYTPNLETRQDVSALCRKLADTMLTIHDEAGQQVFPTGGTRVLAYPAQAYAVADAKGDYGFCYVNIRIASGRSDAAKKAAGDAVLATVQKRFAAAFESSHVGVTIQIDESPGQVYDAKHSNLHPLFAK